MSGSHDGGTGPSRNLGSFKMTAQARITSFGKVLKKHKRKPSRNEQMEDARVAARLKRWKEKREQAASNPLVSFGLAVAEVRKQRGIPRWRFASLIGLSYSNIANIETGQNWPSMPVYIKICSVLGIGVPPLVG